MSKLRILKQPARFDSRPRFQTAALLSVPDDFICFLLLALEEALRPEESPLFLTEIRLCFGVLESARPLSSAFVHQALLR
jgi:hypothetical protein